MALFKKRQDTTPTMPTWSPTVNLEEARPVVLALANAPGSTEGQTRLALAEFVRLSERPSFERIMELMPTDPDCPHRPWIWLATAMRKAAAQGDHHMAAAGLVWAIVWTTSLVPKNNVHSFIELELDPIPADRKAEIRSLGLASAEQLPAEFVIVGDETGSVQAGWLVDNADAVLSG